MKYIVRNNIKKVIYCGYNRKDAMEIFNKGNGYSIAIQTVQTKLGGLYL